jgi:hypothetical protein
MCYNSLSLKQISRSAGLLSMRRTVIRSILAAFGLVASLTGCSAGTLVEQLPESLGGLPADTPPAPRTPYQYPAVHDMPPPRATQPLSDEQQWKLEQALTKLRKRQESEVAAENGDSDKQPAKTAKNKAAKTKTKKKPATAAAGESTGAKANP